MQGMRMGHKAETWHFPLKKKARLSLQGNQMFGDTAVFCDESPWFKIDTITKITDAFNLKRNWLKKTPMWFPA